MSVILKAEHISKQYRLGLVGAGSLKDDLTRWWYRVRRREDPFLKVGTVNNRKTKADSDYVWALQDINFEVNQGEVLGIIGKNGAGKSTLLKILSRVTAPSTGIIKTKGRIASLLEVGTGFHPELTGRENIYLNGAILGMTKAEIQKKEADIIDFSGCARYIDTPVKRYSSGMRVRLAFAVAAFLEPDILVVDEVLAVGDAEFQKKAIGKMQDISTAEGRTVLFVSHNMAAVKNLCTRTIVLEHGKIIFDGSTDEAISLYLEKEYSELKISRIWDYSSKDMPVGEYIKLLSAQVVSKNDYCISSETIIKFKFEILEDLPNFNLSLVLYSQDGVAIFNSISPIVKITKGLHEGQFIIPKYFLNNIKYRIKVFFVNNSQAILTIDDVLVWEAKELEVREINWYGNFAGLLRPSFYWEIN